MNNRNPRVRISSLFLIELILAILTFSLTTAICVQIFVHSHLLSQKSQALALATNECTTIAEICTISNNITEVSQHLDTLYPVFEKHTVNSASYQMNVYYDSDFTISTSPDADYILTVTVSEQPDTLNSTICFSKISEDVHLTPEENMGIYTLNICHHIARGTSYEK